MDNTVCPHCGAPLKQDATGKIIYLRSYACGSYGNLALANEFSQSVSCMQAQIKRLQADINEQFNKGEFYRSLCKALTNRVARLKEQRNAARVAFYELTKAIYGN